MVIFRVEGFKAGCIGYLAHPFKKAGLGLLDHTFRLAQNSMEGQGEPVLLAG